MLEDYIRTRRKNSKYNWLIAALDELQDDLTLPWNSYPCLDWPWGTNTGGYAFLRLPRDKGDRNCLATHIIFGYVHPPLEPGMQALHRCDRRICIRPIHLFSGSHRDNMADMVAKGRGRNRSRERHNLAKMNWEKVHAARKMRSEGATIMEVANHFGLVFSSMRSLLVGETWKPE